MHRTTTLTLITLTTLCTACGGDDAPTENLGPQQVRFALVGAAESRTGTAGELLADVLVVTATHGASLQSGTPAAGLTVSFVVVEPDCGRAYAGTAVTDAAGQAKERWELGTKAGTCHMEVRAVDQVTGEPRVLGSFIATVEPAAVATVAWVSDTAVVPLDDSLAIGAFVRQAADRYGNPITAPPITATVAGAGLAVRGGWLVASGGVEATGDVEIVVGTETRHAVPYAVVRDLRAVRWRAQFLCRNIPRGTTTGDGAVIDSVWYDLTSDSASYHAPGAEGTATLWLSGTLTQYLEDDDSATWPVAGFAGYVESQTVDTLDVIAHTVIGASGPQVGPAVLTSAAPVTYTGGTWCPNLTGYRSSPAMVLTALP